MIKSFGKNFLLFTSLNKFANLSNRALSSTAIRFCDQSSENPTDSNHNNKKSHKPELDRTKIIAVETSIRYLVSEAYKTTYGDQPVWVQYRRNHKGAIPPRKTRKTCIRAGIISTGSPCPICRDEYLVLDHKNLDLLKQFISPYTGQVRFETLLNLSGSYIFQVYFRFSVTKRLVCVRRNTSNCWWQLNVQKIVGSFHLTYHFENTITVNTTERIGIVVFKSLS